MFVTHSFLISNINPLSVINGGRRPNSKPDIEGGNNGGDGFNGGGVNGGDGFNGGGGNGGDGFNGGGGNGGDGFHGGKGNGGDGYNDGDENGGETYNMEALYISLAITAIGAFL